MIDTIILDSWNANNLISAFDLAFFMSKTDPNVVRTRCISADDASFW